MIKVTLQVLSASGIESLTAAKAIPIDTCNCGSGPVAFNCTGVASLSFDGSLSPFLSGLLPFVEMSL